jgi:hypothetical protein
MNVRNLDTNKSKTIQVLGFPRLKPVSKIRWEKIYSSMVEPNSGVFYPERDLHGNVIELLDDGPRARAIYSQIIRLKSVIGKEYLYSIGTIYGFNSLRVLVSYPYYKKEVYTKTFFKKNRFFSKTGHMTEIIKSPLGQQEQYLLEFSSSAVDVMFSHVLKPDTLFVYRTNRHKKPSNPCSFIVKDESTGTAIAVE